MVEPTREAEEAWTDVIVKGTAMRGDFLRECTPGYYNNEGRSEEKEMRNATYGFGSPAFIKLLREWREAGDFAGLEMKYFDKEDREAADVDESGGEVGVQPMAKAKEADKEKEDEHLLHDESARVETEAQHRVSSEVSQAKEDGELLHHDQAATDTQTQHEVLREIEIMETKDAD